MSELSAAATDWLVDGERGLSSMAMFNFLLLRRAVSPYDYPHDPDDFQRCERLARAVPEVRERLPFMASQGTVWPRLVRHWGEIARIAEEEIPGIFEGRVGRAPKTYSLMSDLIDDGCLDPDYGRRVSGIGPKTPHACPICALAAKLRDEA